MFTPVPRHETHPRTAPGNADARLSRFAAALAAITGQIRPAPATVNSRRRTTATSGLLPHTIQLCIHCRHNPAGFWVSRTSDQTARRPWCLSCCQDLDPGCQHIKPSDPQEHRES